jgi:hypothetical protein
MKAYVAIVATALMVGLLVTLVFANPAMLPKHPGYPAGSAVSPVTGQPLANDPGQTNAGGEKALLEAAAAEDAHVAQNLMDENNQRIIQKEGAGQLPTVQGPNIKIEPPVKEATRMK